MHFNSLTFAVFLPAVFVLYWALAPRREGMPRLQNALLLGASYLFYGWWDARFLGLVFASSMVDYWVGRGLADENLPEKRRKMLLAVSLTANLGALAFFKYCNFFIESARDLLSVFGVGESLHTLEIILPVGISFYTFQTISYTVDIYRGAIQPTRDPIAFLAFVSFFPQLVAGPIERATDLLPQFLERRGLDIEQAKDGLRQLLWGMTKKVLIADNLAGPVEAAFNASDQVGGLVVLLATGLFFVQLYCDFSGYADIAIGAARLLGFRLSRNFAYPFFSRSFTEFWQRWHITLNTWLRDYVFMELEMRMRRRYSAWRRQFPKAERPPRNPPIWKSAFNMTLVFTLSGLWHGAAWTYVLWGLLNGLLLVPELIRRRPVPAEIAGANRWLPSVRDLSLMLWVNGMVLLTLVFFRADSMGQAGTIFARMFTDPVAGFVWLDYAWPVVLAAFPIVVEWFARHRPHALAIADWPQPLRWAVYVLLCLAMVVHGSTQSREFVYFQF